MPLIVSFLIILILIILNGVFVAAEFSIIGVRPSRIEQLVDEGNRTAKWVHDIVTDSHQMDRYIATAQLGITLASLGLGMIGEPAIAHLVEEPLHDWFGLEGAIVHTISFFIALGLITYLHVVLGEMVPKSIALQGAEKAVLTLAVPMNLIGRLFHWPVNILNWIGAAVLKIIRVPPPDETNRIYTPTELEYIVSESYEGGLLASREQELVENIFAYTERLVSHVMTPRVSMRTIPVDISESDLNDLAINAIHSRFPVYDTNPDKVIGVLHVKDFIRQQINKKPFDVRSMIRDVSYVPETRHIDGLLEEFRREHHHMALVIDEHGSLVGLVTLEDLIEEVVGEVRDEFDTAEIEPLRLIEPGYLLAQGLALITDVEEYVSLGKVPHEINTISGLIQSALGRLPKEGETLELEDEVRLRVEAMNDRVITEVSIRFPANKDS